MLIQLGDEYKERMRREDAQGERRAQAADFQAQAKFSRCIVCGQDMFGANPFVGKNKGLCAICETAIELKLDAAQNLVAIDGEKDMVAVTRGTKPIDGVYIRPRFKGEPEPKA